ncbi:SRPBCC family protein [Methylophilus aquaticus]|uniref:SRPBCC family protein n=1 Tax=Methylophilus aquaticus TaxID=1971610 RepID=A0ABT9JUG7_9PROT|nr:SRPBCC family protein [Methylophilus aquaticus]MDP8568230.1 SRPBCC family protein [Methylophilus aquaticus]
MKLLMLLLGLSVSSVVLAHGPTPQKTDESVQVGSSAADMWKRVSDPCAIAQWHPEVTACSPVNEKQQTLTLKNGKQLLQEIDEVAQAEMTVSYRLSGEIDLEALPVSSLNGKIKVSPDGSGAKISWTARYYRAFTGNEPPAGQDDESAKSAVDSFVKAGLQGLKEGRAAKSAAKSHDLIDRCCVALRSTFKRWGLNWCA